MIATNIEQLSDSNEIFSPLETENGEKTSDHSIVLSTYRMGKSKKVEWVKYQARQKTDENCKLFGNALTAHDWTDVLNTETPSMAAVKLKNVLNELMDRFFPLKTYRVRAENPPWITHGILRMIDKRKNVFKTDKKCTPRWKKLKKLTEKMITEKKKRVC